MAQEERTSKAEVFVRHIEHHLESDQVVICKICEKSIDQIYDEEKEPKEVGLEETPFHIKVTVPSLRLEIDVVAVGDPALCVMVAGGVVNFLRINDMGPKVVILP
jgi:hypothetical protein